VQAVNGQWLGVLSAHLHWAWTREVQFSVVPESAKRERIGVTVYAANGDVILDSGGSGWSRPPDLPALTDARKFRGSMIETTPDGASYVTGYARSRGFHDFRGLGWVVAVRQPVALAFAPVRELQRFIVGWGLAFTALLVTVAWITLSNLRPPGGLIFSSRPHLRRRCCDGSRRWDTVALRLRRTPLNDRNPLCSITHHVGMHGPRLMEGKCGLPGWRGWD